MDTELVWMSFAVLKGTLDELLTRVPSCDALSLQAETSLAICAITLMPGFESVRTIPTPNVPADLDVGRGLPAD